MRVKGFSFYHSMNQRILSTARKTRKSISAAILGMKCDINQVIIQRGIKLEGSVPVRATEEISGSAREKKIIPR